ncbi:hypothetical protein LWI29_036376 [Acer saccharum]|uniref:3-beta hydroxysteroid dehydrogenase/isomerase domain-containing protein n=1 Tax=Acer saccharum TaxID=4024 RepID=A0AA39RJQ2_ACESA|nr:hypothetical protein LWI29_036376 [Acer saccharum]
MSGEGKVVCVTGASGYIASWLVKQLLQLGYTVKATVRDPIDGCDGVFHTASPVLFSANDPQADIVDAAVKGTLNVLKSCVKSPSVKRVIYTSSMAAVMCNEKPLTPDTVVDETWFSDPAFCEETKPTLNLSVEIILKLVNGEKSYPSPYKLVDVKDVAHAHIQALELPSASGRYCIVESIRSSTETLEILRQLFPTLHLPTKLEDDKPNEPTYKVSRKKAESLGINFISWEVSLKDTIESFKEKGFLTF